MHHLPRYFMAILILFSIISLPYWVLVFYIFTIYQIIYHTSCPIHTYKNPSVRISRYQFGLFDYRPACNFFLIGNDEVAISDEFHYNRVTKVESAWINLS